MRATESLVEQIEEFHGNLMDAEILDAEGVHHEFNAGGHGQKLDFDLIPTYADIANKVHTLLYAEWVSVSAAFIRSEFPRLPGVILGVANGTNRVAKHVAESLSREAEEDVLGFASVKDDEDVKKLWLPSDAMERIRLLQPSLAVVIEDVGTTGSQSVQVAQQVAEAGATEVIVIPTWQRQDRLARLDEAGIEYRPIIQKTLPTYPDKQTCEAIGFCAMGWELIPRGE